MPKFSSCSFTNEEKLECIRREIKQRERVYPRLIENRKITKDFADRQMMLMRSIERDYEQQAAGERLL